MPSRISTTLRQIGVPTSARWLMGYRFYALVAPLAIVATASLGVVIQWLAIEWVKLASGWPLGYLGATFVALVGVLLMVASIAVPCTAMIRLAFAHAGAVA